MLGLKVKLFAIGGGIIAFLLALVKVFAGQAKRAKKQAKQFKAVIERKEDIENLDNELDRKRFSKKAQIKKEISEGKPVKSLENPNEY